MLKTLKSLVGLGPKADFAELVKQGAQIIDVRTPEEFKGGHIKGSHNIPVNVLQRHLSKLSKDKPVITCCRSGVRSASALGILKSNGFTEVYNGGGWDDLQRKIQSTKR
jgi:rhodanese-related sulfurtransferase